MILALLATLLVTVSGALATYFYEDDAPAPARLCMGACTGLAAWGLLGFVLSSLAGLTPWSVAATTLWFIVPLILFMDARRRLFHDLRAAWAALGAAVRRPTRRNAAYGAFYLFVGALLWRVFDRALVYDAQGGIATGVQNNLGDLPFHLSVMTGFAHGQNFPPMDPTYAGIKFTYPFLTDFISAMYVAAGADLKSALFIENYALALSLVGLLHFWTLRLTKDRIAGLVAPLLVIFSGGLGWMNLLKQAKDSDAGLFGLLAGLPQKYTIGTDPYRFGNSLTTLLVPQRGLLLGVPLALVVFAVVWKLTKESRGVGEWGSGGEQNAATEAAEPLPKSKKKKKPPAQLPHSPTPPLPYSPTAAAIGAGVVAGLLPLVHAHTYVVVMMVAGFIALLSFIPLLRPDAHRSSFIIHHLKIWSLFFVVAVAVAGPQMLWATHGSAVQTSKFYALKTGWDAPEGMSLAWFWFRNTGLFIPLTLAALVWRRGENWLVGRRLRYFFLPFTLCFVAANIFQMSPWIWDNIKVLYYWWVGSAPLVALFLAHLWRQKERAVKLLAVAFLFTLTAAGAADVWGIANGKTELGIFDKDNIALAEIIKQRTPPRAVILQAPSFSMPVFLSGRQPVMGYPGHVWSHGIEPGARESDIRSIYANAPHARQLLTQYGVQYIVVGPQETQLPGFNEGAVAGLQLVGQAGAYRLYQVK
jgi:hypothetical protein